MFGLGFPELLVVLVLALLVFGANRLPELAKAIGKSFRAFKDGIKEAEEGMKDEDEGGKNSGVKVKKAKKAKK